MTCVISSHWQPPFDTYGWAPMNLGDSTPSTSVTDRSQYGYVSSESESRHVSTSSGKKRASRAGTRSVSTLSAAQLERKRANDREAQRAIRQRTKDHIESLERNISDLRAANDASEKMAAAARQRARELEEENAFLRSKLGEPSYPMTVVPDSHRAVDHSLVAAQTGSPSTQAATASVARTDPTSTPQSTLSINTSQSSNSRHGTWQQGPTQYSSTAASTPASLSAHSAIPIGSNLTSWRSNDSTANIHSATGQPQLQTQPTYQNQTLGATDRSSWAVAPAYPYHEQQRTQAVAQTSPQPQQHYASTPIPQYGAGTSQPQPPYVGPPQAEFQNMTGQAPTSFPVPQQDYSQQPAYPMTHLQVPAGTPTATDYVSQTAAIHPPQMLPASYPTTQAEQHYGQPRVQYAEDPTTRGYTLQHYPAS